MVSEYYGYSTTQTSIVSKVKGSVVNETGSPTDIKNAVEYATLIVYTTSGSYTSATEISNISNQIKTSRPVIMFFVNSAGNHVCVATAVDNSGTYVKYNNSSPLNSGKVYHKKYSELITDSTNKYTQYMTVSKK